MELPGVGKRAFHGFLAPLVDRLAPWGQPMSIGALSSILPDMTGDSADGLGIGGAGGQQGAGLADGGSGPVVLVAAPVCGGIGEQLPLRTAVAILFRLIERSRKSGSGFPVRKRDKTTS